jgi:DNA-binding NarL/FixJ family response regulator
MKTASLKGQPLTRRQLDFLRALAQGLRRKQIAEVMGIGIGTVQDHSRDLFKKLNVHTSAGAVAEGFRRGLLK